MGSGRCVIFGGGGVTGIAWEIGIIKGLADAGISLAAHADTLIGTSAGSFASVAAVAGPDLETRFETELSGNSTEVAARMSDELLADYMAAYEAHAGDAIGLAKAMGTIARKAETISPEIRVQVVRDRLRTEDWPGGVRLVFTALDADTGELALLDRASGLTLIEAANASGAVPGLWPVVHAGGRHWIDGAMVSSNNAHLGADFAQVLVVAPSPEGLAGFPTVAARVAELEAAGVQAVLIEPDEQTREAIGSNPFDPARRAPAAEQGRRQGRQLAGMVARVWLGEGVA